MSRLLGFEHVLLRAVPRVDRGESINVGVAVYCQAADFLGAAVHVDRDRLAALDPGGEVEGLSESLRAALNTIQAVCAGDASSGPAAESPRGERFRWLAAPRSTVVQPGPIHGGVTADPAAELQRLLDRLVR
ncbi:MAG TPA: DUF3037 domain-containing protein [Nocardioidaceae bacterium]|nr:DUF3037 domain-containing protein [Nocardioidaceae bacterium]